MPLRHSQPPSTTLCLFCGESVPYPSIRLSIRSLVPWIEALGYAVDVHSFPYIDSQSFPCDFWGVAIAITKDTLLFVVLPSHAVVAF